MEPNKKQSKGRPKGKPTNKMNYKLYYYNPISNEYNYIGDFLELWMRDSNTG